MERLACGGATLLWLKLYIGLVYLGEAIEEWSTCFGDAWLHHLFGECCKDNEGWRGHHFWWLEFELELSSLYVEGSARCSSILLM